MLKHGTWWISSNSDPRWNTSGEGTVGMFIGYESIPAAKNWIERCEAEYGSWPDDLSFGYMKD